MIANEFLAYVAVMATVCCAILAIFVSRRITGPILQLTKISKRMAELDFDAKYKPNKRQNEVDELGEHMNSCQHVRDYYFRIKECEQRTEKKT